MAVGIRLGESDEGTSTPAPVSQENEQIRYVVDVIREQTVVQDIYRHAQVVDLVRPGGTVVNIGAGPVLPANPYEGQVWILT